MKNSKIELIFLYFFIFNFIFVSMSQKCPKNGPKFFVYRFTSKLPYNLTLIWRIQKLNVLSHIFSHSSWLSHIFSHSSWFLPWVVKNALKNESKIFLRLSWKFPYNLILMWRIHRSNSFSQIFPFRSSSLPRLVKNVFKNKSNFFSSDFHENCHIS